MLKTHYSSKIMSLNNKLNVSNEYDCNYPVTFHFPMPLSLFLGGWVLYHTNTVKVIWYVSSCIDGGRPKVPLHTLFQAVASTRIEPPTFG